MREKLKDDKFARSLLFKFISVLVIASIAVLLLNVLSQNKDGRTQIIDEDGGSEYEEMTLSKEELRLAEILGKIKGVGQVDVMITHKDREISQSVFKNNEDSHEIKVKGVIITATGADNPVVRSKIMDAVASVYDIPIQNVMVFEKNKEVYK